MTFEEFFKKKKINMVLLNAAEPALFAEFELHYNQMGEKSFDHTKKYWFNMLRRKYVLPPEPKVEKVIIENQLAEQTITEAITAEPQTTTAPKIGFKPKFKNAGQPAAPIDNKPDAVIEPEPEPMAEASAPKLGFKPKFKTAVAPTDNIIEPTEEKPESVTTTDAPKLGFKPKFKSAVEQPAVTPVEPAPQIIEDQIEPSENSSAPKLGFKPKFNSATTQPLTEPIASAPEIVGGDKLETISTEIPAPKLGFKPKFKSATTQPAAITAEPVPEIIDDTTPSVDAVPDIIIENPEPLPAPNPVVPAPKLGFKPKFKAASLKPPENPAENIGE